MSGLAVYSGQVRLCAVGVSAPFKDITGKSLASGDIVVIYPENGGIVDFSLTVVIQEGDELFVMGIKSVPLDLDDDGQPTSYWRVQKIKDHSDVIAGEHWSAWGFSYKQDQENPNV